MSAARIESISILESSKDEDSELLLEVRGGPTVEHSVLFEGYHYATLDGTPPDAQDYGLQENFAELPQGWQLAPSDPAIVEAVVATHIWGAQVLICKDGTAWNTRYYHCAGGQHGEGFLLKGGNGYKPNLQGTSSVGTLAMMPSGEVYTCQNYRVLVRTPQRIQWSTSAHCSELLRGLWVDRRFCDCDIVCGDTTLPCHRAVLAQGSPVFDRMLHSGMLEAQRQRVEVGEAEAEVVRALITFIYTGEVECGSFAPELMRLADFYQVDSLVGLCAERALEAVSRENISAVARTLRSLQGRPEIPAMWARLMEKVHEDPALFSAVMQQL